LPARLGQSIGSCVSRLRQEKMGGAVLTSIYLHESAYSFLSGTAERLSLPRRLFLRYLGPSSYFPFSPLFV